MKKQTIRISPSQSYVDLGSASTQYGNTYPRDVPYIRMSRESGNYSRYHSGRPVTFKIAEDGNIYAYMNYSITVKNVSMENPLKFDQVEILIIYPDGKEQSVFSSDERCYTNLHENFFRVFVSERSSRVDLRLKFGREELLQKKLPIKLQPNFSFEYFNHKRDIIIQIIMSMEEAYILEEPLI